MQFASLLPFASSPLCYRPVVYPFTLVSRAFPPCFDTKPLTPRNIGAYNGAVRGARVYGC